MNFVFIENDCINLNHVKYFTFDDKNCIIYVRFSNGFDTKFWKFNDSNDYSYYKYYLIDILDNDCEVIEC